MLGNFMEGREGLLFRTRSRDAVPMTARHARRRIREWFDRARINSGASPHSLRHSFAMRLLNHTGCILTVKAALHHSAITSTMTYLECSDGRLRRALESVSTGTQYRTQSA